MPVVEVVLKQDEEEKKPVLSGGFAQRYQQDGTARSVLSTVGRPITTRTTVQTAPGGRPLYLLLAWCV